MAGIIANLGQGDALSRYTRYGVYSTRMERPEATGRGWGTAREATIADYTAVAEGDLVFFFQQRFIYGVGRVVRMPGALRAVLCNYPRAWDLATPAQPDYLWENEPDDPANHPFVIFFEPHPRWFAQGIDMDEALSSDVHNLVTMLPFFAGVSFIRVDDFEASYLASLIARGGTDASLTPDEHKEAHGRAAGLITPDLPAYEIDIDALTALYSASGRVRHEALLEAWLVDALVNRFDLVAPCLNRQHPWDFVGRQIPASPFKPPDYIDRVDILCYDLKKPVEGAIIPNVTEYLALELKKDAALTDDVLQTLKYVDWLAHTRRGGDYSDIQAATVAAEYPLDVRSMQTRRQFIRPRRPYGPTEWDRLKLLKYRATEGTPALQFSVEDRAD